MTESVGETYHIMIHLHTVLVVQMVIIQCVGDALRSTLFLRRLLFTLQEIDAVPLQSNGQC